MSRALEIEGARIALDGAPLISLSARVPAGAILTVMGPSGSGKSTLLAWLAGAPLPAFRTSGRLRLDGRDLTHLPPRERQVGLIFQDDLLFPHMSVGGNLAFGLPPQIRGARRRAGFDMVRAAASWRSRPMPRMPAPPQDASSTPSAKRSIQADQAAAASLSKKCRKMSSRRMS